MKYLKAFEDHEKYTKELTERKSVSFCKEEKHIHFKNIKKKCLMFKAKEENSTVAFSKVSSQILNLEYSTDEGETWNEYTFSGNTGQTITLQNVDDSVQFRGVNSAFTQQSYAWNKFVMTGKIEGSGDVTSLLNGIGGDVELTDYCFTRLFEGCTSLITAPELPSTTMAQFCYLRMFSGCTSLTTPPSSIGDSSTLMMPNSCEIMFGGCTSLKTAPFLPAETVSGGCYYGMFSGCTSLESAPELPATVLSRNCYYGMFANCTSLVTAPELPGDKPNTGYYQCYACYSHMFENCTKLKNAPSEIIYSSQSGCAYMFAGCTSLETAPEIKASSFGAFSCYAMFAGCTSLKTPPSHLGYASSGYSSNMVSESGMTYMFRNCTALESAPELPIKQISTRAYFGMFENCTSLRTPPSSIGLSGGIIATSGCTNMFKNCTALESAPELPIASISNNCYREMFYGCTSLTTGPSSLPATTLGTYCYTQMFRECTKLTSAPVLPAKTLANYCYEYMFYRCSNLSYVKALFTTTPSATYTYLWLGSVKSTGTFVKNSSASWNVTGSTGIPTGWTVETASS